MGEGATLEASGTVADALTAAGIPLAKVGTRRVRQLSAGEKELYVWILRQFSKRDPPSSNLVRAEAERLGLDFDRACTHLATQDLIHFDPDGQVAVAYPFSGCPTRHRVLINGQDVYAMCAIDALGIAPMFEQPIVVNSRDPVSDAEISVRLRPDGTATWQPDKAVVLAGRCCDGAAFQSCCQVLNFFASPETAEVYLREQPDVRGFLIAIPEAIELGRLIFGDALNEDS